MDVNVQALNFEMAERLANYIDKKIERLQRHSDDITSIDIKLKVTKPQSEMNKEVSVAMRLPGKEIIAGKVADSFEAALDESIDALKHQLEKYKNCN